MIGSRVGSRNARRVLVATAAILAFGGGSAAAITSYLDARKLTPKT